MNIQVLAFDPDNPKSLSGLRLTHRSTFHTGHFPATTHLLTSSLAIPTAPSSTFDAPADDNAPATQETSTHQLLHTTQSGTLSLVTPLTEATYRRLASLTTYLANTLDSACGLNPKAWRVGAGDVGEGGKGGVLDGNLVMRWGELGYAKQREGLGKIGGEGEEWVFEGEREVLGGWGVFGRRGGAM